MEGRGKATGHGELWEETVGRCVPPSCSSLRQGEETYCFLHRVYLVLAGVAKVILLSRGVGYKRGLSHEAL